MAKLPARPNPRSFSDAELNVIKHHRAELARGGVKNSKGGTSTFLGHQNEILGRETVYPSVRGGKILDDKTAKDWATVDQIKSKGKQWPTYDTSEKAQNRERVMHLQMEEDLIKAGDKSAKSALKKMGYK